MITSQVHIHSTDAKIGMQSVRPPMNIDQGAADLSIRKSGSDYLSISQEAASLYIDQSKAFAEANLKSVTQLAADWAAKGRASVQQYAGSKAEEGNQLAKIERGVTVAQLAQQKSQQMPAMSNIAYMPHSIDRVSIQVQPGRLDIQAPTAKMEINATPHPVKIDIPKWNMNTYMMQKPSLSFSVETSS